MEDHMKICRLEEVECEFKEIGCFEKFRREDLEEHMRDEAQIHLSMMAATSVKVQQEFQAKLQEQERKLGEQERQFKEKIEELEKRFGAKFEEYKKGTETELLDLKRRCGILWKFTLENFREEKAKDKLSDWKSPPMYTHPGGYKFCIGIDANGCSNSRGKSVNVELWKMPGEYDDQLRWPVTVKFTLELINHFENGGNKMYTITKTWRKPAREYGCVCSFNTVPGQRYHFISHSELPHNTTTGTHFLKDDTLHFMLSTQDIA
jgi:hypothetical protein